MTLKVICTEGVVIEEDLLNKFTEAFKLISKEEDLDDNASINIKIIKDKEMLNLNNHFRNKESSTNVLSFTNEDISKSITGNLGDIAINYDYILKESNEQNKTFDDHMIHMLIHGIYHILGFEHDNDKVANVMEKKEVTLLNKLNISNPYN
ncbi:MAG: rRNA maturation RNase YbeY [SAR86 cluster bacterium]|uniref:Endoribonuclease YbeY n=1 Tax=SAR86 cluster bacterium TaxID=2030880 RepID=A0A520N6Q5_9GAMM|nr:MAG: rRNA maturation RNase YbeY [SAR86 cluster bacterium]